MPGDASGAPPTLNAGDLPWTLSHNAAGFAVWEATAHGCRLVVRAHAARTPNGLAWEWRADDAGTCLTGHRGTLAVARKAALQNAVLLASRRSQYHGSPFRPTAEAPAAPATPEAPKHPGVVTGHCFRWLKWVGARAEDRQLPLDITWSVWGWCITARPDGFGVRPTSVAFPPLPATLDGQPFERGIVQPGSVLAWDGTAILFGSDAVPLPSLTATPAPAAFDAAEESLAELRARLGARLRTRLDVAVEEAARAYVAEHFRGYLGSDADALTRAVERHLPHIRASLPSGRWRVTGPAASR